MARQVEELLPGVSQAVFGAHTHNYRKLTQVGGDADIDYGTPTRADVVDDSEVHAGESPAVRSVGVAVATSPTSAPV